jgi:mono/diheme cytochrome c family protein
MVLPLLGVTVVIAAHCGRPAHGAQEEKPVATLGDSTKPVASQGDTAKAVASLGDTKGVRPGINPAVIYGNRTDPYTGNAAAIMEGRRLFVAYNCSGCHGGRAGGGMGPSLRDSAWTHGNSDTQLLADIVEGRSAGMPAWGKMIPEDQMWKIIAYLRTLGTDREPDRVLQ